MAFCSKIRYIDDVSILAIAECRLSEVEEHLDRIYTLEDPGDYQMLNYDSQSDIFDEFDSFTLTEDEINTDEERRHQSDYAQARILLRLAKEHLLRAVSAEMRNGSLNRSLLMLVSVSEEICWSSGKLCNC